MKFKEQVKEGREKAKKERRRTAQDKQNNNVDGENAVLWYMGNQYLWCQNEKILREKWKISK